MLQKHRYVYYRSRIKSIHSLVHFFKFCLATVNRSVRLSVGGGLGGTRVGGPDDNIKHSGRVENNNERYE